MSDLSDVPVPIRQNSLIEVDKPNRSPLKSKSKSSHKSLSKSPLKKVASGSSGIKSIPETSKYDFKSTHKKSDKQQEKNDDSFESATSCLIPSESERFEIGNKLTARGYDGQIMTLRLKEGSKRDDSRGVSWKGSDDLGSDQKIKIDKIMPGQASKSLLENQNTKPLVNEVRVSDNRPNKALSFVGDGLLSANMRGFNLNDVEKKATPGPYSPESLKIPQI